MRGYDIYAEALFTQADFSIWNFNTLLVTIHNSPANSRVRKAAETSLHPVVFCPAHRGEKSLPP
jgi:hypothetical protein